MKTIQTSEAPTRAASGSNKAAQRLKDLKRGAMRLAVYIRELGAEPIELRGKDYHGWERGLQKQYQQLRENLGKEAGQAARVRGRAVIRREGLSSAVADLLPTPARTRRKKNGDPKRVTSEIPPQATTALFPMEAPANQAHPAVVPNPLVCQRKYRHTNFLSAMLHARRIHSPGLHVYPCEFCGGGLHVGHDPESDHTQRARAVTKRLRSIRKQLAAMERQSADLRRERSALLAEEGVIRGWALSHLRAFLLRIEAWLANWEQ